MVEMYEIPNNCRTCLSETNSENFISVLSTNAIYHKTYAELIMAITPVIIDDDEPFSLIICQPCAELISRFYNFQLQCVQADVLIRKNVYIKSENTVENINIKLEEIEVGKVEVQDIENTKSTTLETKFPYRDDKSQLSEEHDYIDNISQENNNVQCTKCPKLFRTRRGLRRHCINAHAEKVIRKYSNNSANTVKCKICTKSFRTLTGLSKHFLFTHSTNSKNNANNDAEENNKNTTSRRIRPQEFLKNDDKHKKESKLVGKRLITTEELSTYSNAEKPNHCIPCDKTFGNRRKFLSHLHLVHVNPKVTCEVCGKIFSNSGNLSRHKRSHLGTNQYMCEFCGKKYTAKYSLDEHKLTHTTVNKKYKCHICEQAFISRARLSRHMYQSSHNKSADAQIKFECDICKRKYSTRSSLWLHKYRSHSVGQSIHKLYRCRICSKILQHSGGLRTHMFLHTNQKPYKCQFCPKTFRQTAHLRSHVFIHTGEKPYKCEYCSKSFRHLTTLNDHTRIHTGEKPFHCDTCGERFAYSSNFKKHILKH